MGKFLHATSPAEDSNASAAASLADLALACKPSFGQRGLKSKLPVGFLLPEACSPGKKMRRPASRMEEQATAAGAAAAGPRLKVTGPCFIQTLRGRLFGRSVALILCGEGHEEAIDLTRSKSITEEVMGWTVQPPFKDGAGLDPSEAIATQNGLTLQGAKKWARERIVDDYEDDISMTGAFLVFTSLGGRIQGSAALFRPCSKPSEQHPLLPGSAVLTWLDTDVDARDFNKRRFEGVVPAEDQDALIAQRKSALLGDGMELFDDWLIRQSKNSPVHMEFMMEAPVSASEVELHIEPGVGPAPLAHKCLREMGLDDEERQDSKETGASGTFLDYLHRQVAAHLPSECVHYVDPRMVGDAEDHNLPTCMHGSFEALRKGPAPVDLEDAELQSCGAGWAHPDKGSPQREIGADSGTLPSWEAFLGASADLVYYSPHIKADYTPFLAGCVGSSEKFWRFIDALFFDTVPRALSEIRIDDETRPMAYTRSLAYQPPSAAAPLRRPMGTSASRGEPILVRAAPVDRYLKAIGSNPPRTWVSGLTDQLERAEAGQLVAAARTFYRGAVNSMLQDPKGNDPEGDNFVVWLCICHPEIYNDIDTTCPDECVRAKLMKSLTKPSHRYNLRDIQIPGGQDAFTELVNSKQPVAKPSSARERLLSQIVVDSYNLRLVDLAMILKVGTIVKAAEENSEVAIVVYAGLVHTRSVTKFWRQWGFSHTGLPRNGKAGKEKDAEDHDSRCFALPSYLHDLTKLFPVPASLPDAGDMMARAESRAAKSQDRNQ